MTRRRQLETQLIPTSNAVSLPCVPMNEPDPIYFAQLVEQGVRPKDAAIEAGYSEGTNYRKLLNNLNVRRVRENIQQQRTALQELEGTSFGAIGRRMANIVQEGEDKDAIGAAKVLNEMAGNNAPKELKIESRSMIASFNNLTSVDLHTILGAVGVDLADFE
jgi:hypothetical protein